MPIEKGKKLRKIAIEGSFRVSCGDLNFRLRYSPGVGVADFPSMGMLARAGKMAKDIGGLIADLPPLPPAITLPGRSGGKVNTPSDTEFLVAVKSRPVGRISFETSKPKFIPTPLRFFKKV